VISIPNISAASGCQRRSHSQVAAQITSPATPSALPAKGSPLISAVARPLAARTTSAAGTPAGQDQAGTPFARQTRVASADATAKKVRISMSMRRRSLPRSEAPPPVPIPHQTNGSVLFQVHRGTGAAARDVELHTLHARIGGVEMSAQVRVTGTAGFLMAKAAAAHHRQFRRD
jgi:hypothetical protein